MIIHDVLETFDNVTHIFSYIYEPNLHMVILECIKIILSIKQTKRRCELYEAVIQPEPVGSSKGKSRFGFLGPDLKKQRPDSSSSSSSNVGIDEYLSYEIETKDDFHIIQWWKNHSLKFLILARIAKDIHAIPASTIASKSAFSVGRRVLDEKRSRLAPQSIGMR
ncbi:putative AC transposase, partial [Bienertia sinuspersici]